MGMYISIYSDILGAREVTSHGFNSIKWAFEEYDLTDFGENHRVMVF